MAGVLRSMTGFGQAQGELSPRLAAQVRVTSLNSRFLEVTLRTHPRIETAELEAALRPLLSERVARGRVQAVVELRSTAREVAGLVLHWEVASSLLDALGQRPKGLELAPLALRDLLALPGFAEGGGELSPHRGGAEEPCWVWSPKRATRWCRCASARPPRCSRRSRERSPSSSRSSAGLSG